MKQTVKALMDLIIHSDNGWLNGTGLFFRTHLASSVSCDALFLCTLPLYDYDITISYGTQCVPVHKIEILPPFFCI